MLPPRPIRRLVLVPLVIVLAAGLAAATPLVALLSVVVNVVRRQTRPDRVRRSRALRVAVLALGWSAAETAALTVALCLWIASGFGGRLDTDPYQARHYAVMRWMLDLIYRVARRACGLRVEVTGPPDASACDGRPLIVLCRHAGPGDSLLLARYLLEDCGRHPRVVMKAALQLDPSVDVVGNRVPNAFLRRPGTAGARRQHIQQVRRLAAGLGPRDVLVLFPEGGNWTPLRWRRGIGRLRRLGHDELASRAAAMPNVLPPRPGGALAALAACPAADVIFVAHTGLDRIVSVGDVWRSLLADLEVRARWWRVPSASVPREADRGAQVSWLYDWWERIDAWITAQAADIAQPPGPARAVQRAPVADAAQPSGPARAERA
jgi:1-acyl-sn-glycerol-3-phosphate acyltransferase